MATKYWTAGGNENWSDSSNWSTTLGPPRTANTTAPSATDAAIFDATSGSGTATLDISPTIQTLTCTGFTGTLAFGTNTISLNSTSTVFTGATTMAVTGTPLIILDNNTASARTITPTAVTEANSISFRITSGTGALGLTAGSYRDIDFTDGTNPTGFAGNVTNTGITIYGNFKASTSGMTRTAGTQTYTFAGAVAGTRTITTASVVFDNPFTFNSTAATPTDVIFQLQANLILGPTPAGVNSTRNLTLTSGTLDLNNFTATAGVLSSTGSVTRVLAFGASGKIVLTGFNTNVAVTTTATGLTITGSKRVELSYSGNVGTRTILGPGSGSALEGTNLLDYFVTAGTDIVTFSSARNFGTIDFSNGGTSTFTTPGSFTNQAINVYGNLVLNSTMVVSGGASTVEFLSTGLTGTKTITTANQTLDFPITFNGAGGTYQLQDALTLSSTRTVTLTNGTLDLNDYTLTTGIFSSSNSNTRVLAFGSFGRISITGSNTTVCNTNTATGLTVTGGKLIQLETIAVGTRTITGASDATAIEGTNLLDYYFVAGSDTVTFTASCAYNSINFSFFGAFTGTLTNNAISIYGNFAVSSSMILNSGTNALSFKSTTGNVILIEPNGQTINNPIIFDGINGVWAFLTALTMGSTQTLTLVNGYVRLAESVTSTVGSFVTTGTNQKYLGSRLLGTQATLSQASGTVNASYLTIQDSNATGGAIFYAGPTNVNAGNNTGWIFFPVPAESNEITMRLRSFTQPRRF